MKKRFGKVQGTLLLTAVLFALSGAAGNKAAETGWIKDNIGWWYRYDNGSYPAGAWLQDQNIWYHFGPDGYMQTDWLLEEGKTWYYLNPDGRMQTGWKELGGIWYYFYDSGAMASNTWIDTYYVDKDGAWVAPSVSSSLEDSIKARIEELKIKYPQDMYWNHMGYENMNMRYFDNYYSETITSVPCSHEINGTVYCNSYYNDLVEYVIGLQCDGFARKLSDEIFGQDAAATAYSYDFSKLKIGDYLRYTDSHSVLVIGKENNSITVAEVNIGGTCMINWGRTITKETLDSYHQSGSNIRVFARY